MTIKALLEEFSDVIKGTYGNTYEMFKNPSSKELEPHARGIVTKNGDLYTSDAFHVEILDKLKKMGIVKKDLYTSSREITSEAVFVQRLGKTNKFYMGEITSSKLNKEKREIVNRLFAKAKKKNPHLIFYKTRIVMKS